MARILIVSCDITIRNLLLDVLAEEGYMVVEAHNSYEGLWQNQHAPPAMATSDIMYLVAF